MTYISRVEGRDWYRYRNFALDLEPIAYSVEAEGGADALRSNWIGKSSWLGLIPFVLYGWHVAQEEPERAVGFEDRWIRGREGDEERAQEGGGVVLLSDGTRVERTKRRGQSAQLRVWLPGVQDPAAGDEAQRIVDRVVGFDRRDFLTAVFARQKRCAQLVTERPSERMRLVADWLDLDRVERAAKATRARLSAAVAERDGTKARLAERRVQLDRILDREYGGARLRDRRPEDALASLERARESASEELEAHLRRREARAVWQAEQDAAERAERSRARLADAERRLASLPALRECVDASEERAARDAARARRDSAARVARGEFSGACPVAPGFTCPARAEINAGGERARVELREAERVLDAAVRAHDDARSLAGQVDAERAERQHIEAEVRALRSVAPPRPPGNRFPGAPPAPDPEAERRAREAVRAATESAALLRRDLSELERLRAEIEEVEGGLPVLDRRVAELRWAALALGRGGAQRTVAEVAVGEIAEDANWAMASCGVDLSVRMRWRDEGNDLASACEACGAPFPKSARARTCEACGADRQRVAHDRLTVLLSDRSGGAEDLAGLFLQVAAFEWLRARRSSPWRTLLFDEPFGALDEAHRRAVSAYFARLSRVGGAQLLVVAHQPGILEVLPGRIAIKDRGSESTVEVTS